jgi:hypothetical protein
MLAKGRMRTYDLLERYNYRILIVRFHTFNFD